MAETPYTATKRPKYSAGRVVVRGTPAQPLQTFVMPVPVKGAHLTRQEQPPGLWRSFVFGGVLMAASFTAHALYYL